ncbi:REP-associated tyrosine transposase [Mesobacillus subterraneus]|uniref:Transposase n=1 Tax=Mesobacillus subterraneus TaxID=285983 RepID=A0A427TVI8_9BACI|nr:transposase [Mesobacillus subterraneus]RSD28441.1 transposase [Mesobacillus subterraneus]
MPRKARMKSRNGIYHVMLRGANRQEIFHDDADNVKFLEVFKKYKEQSGMNVYAWCLMNNHVHLLVKEGDEELAVTMKRIGVSYAAYYNLKYKTTGHLFQDRFRSENVESRSYFLTVVRYIHQNPVKAGMVERVADWRWSSSVEYYGQKRDSLLDQEKVLQMLDEDPEAASEKFKEFNEQANEDECMDEGTKRRKLTDDEAREEIRNEIGNIEIAHVKSLPQAQREDALRKVKPIEGLSLRQSARIFGLPVSLIRKAWM